jgi:hypothetical protein
MKIISINNKPFLNIKSIIKEEVQSYLTEEDYFNTTLPDDVKEYSNRYVGRNVVWYGNPDQMIILHKDEVHGMWGNVYDHEKLNSLVDMIRNAEEKVELECSYGLGELTTIQNIREEQESYHGGSFESDYENLDEPHTTGDEELDKYLGTEYLDEIDNFYEIDSEAISFFEQYKTSLADNTIDATAFKQKMMSEVGNLEGIEVFFQFENQLRDVIENKEGDLGKFEVQLRDGHHRVMGTIEAGEEYVCVNLVKEDIPKYGDHITRVTTK